MSKHTSRRGPGPGTTHIHLSYTRTKRVAQHVAVLGTGKMGSAIATRLAGAGFELVLWNRTRSKAEALGFGTVVDTPAAAAARADIVVSSLTGSEAVLAAFMGPEGALTAGRGTSFIEMSTAGPTLVVHLGALIKRAGGSLVDAPILGAPPVVRAGEATVLVSGADDHVAAAKPVLGAIGTVRHVGSLGSAARLKLVANSMLADVIMAAAELQVAGEDAGLDPDDVFFVLKRAAPGLEARRDGLLGGHHTPTLFAMRDLRKDVDLAMSLYGETAARTPLTGWSRERVDAAAAATPDLDISAVAQFYRRGPSRAATADAALSVANAV